MIINVTVILDTTTATATAVNDIAVTVTLNDEVVNPEATFCERVDSCLDIPTDNGQYVLTITDNVVSWEEFSASGLVDGNGTTVNGNAVDLGGIITDTTSVYYDIAPNEQFGLFYLMNGIIQDGTPANEAIFIGQLPNGATSPDMSMRNGLTVLNVDNEALGTIIGNDKAVIEVFKQAEGYGQIDIEVKSPDESIISALKITPSYMTFGEYIDADNIYLSIDGDLGVYGIGKLDPNVSGTKIIVDDSTETINIGNALNVYNSDNSVEALGAFYIGDKITDGSFRFIQNGGDLLVEKRESGVWVTKATIG
jgi:hypothetical protein